MTAPDAQNYDADGNWVGMWTPFEPGEQPEPLGTDGWEPIEPVELGGVEPGSTTEGNEE